jgi:hypothetical protein
MPYLQDIEGSESMTPKRIVDRRTEKTLPSAAEIAALENERTIKRTEIKRRIAAAQLAESRRIEIVEAIDVVNATKEQLAAEHIGHCSPIQSELSTIEKQQIASIVARETTDEALESRRKELLTKLREANADLEEKIGHRDRLLSALEIDRIAAAKMCNVSLLENELVHSARPETLARMIAMGNVRDRLERTRDALRSDVLNHPREAARLEAELQIIEMMLAKAVVDANPAYRNCINE